MNLFSSGSEYDFLLASAKEFSSSYPNKSLKDVSESLPAEASNPMNSHNRMDYIFELIADNGPPPTSRLVNPPEDALGLDFARAAIEYVIVPEQADYYKVITIPAYQHPWLSIFAAAVILAALMSLLVCLCKRITRHWLKDVTIESAVDMEIP